MVYKAGGRYVCGYHDVLSYVLISNQDFCLCDFYPDA